MIKVAILGAETPPGEDLARKIDSLPDMFLVALVDPSYRGKEQPPSNRRHGDPDEIWKKYDPDVVVILSSGEMQSNYLREAMTHRVHCVINGEVAERFKVGLSKFADDNEIVVCGCHDIGNVNYIIECIDAIKVAPRPGLILRA